MLPLAEFWISEHLLHPNRHPLPTLIGEVLFIFGISKTVLSLFIASALMLYIFPKIAQDTSLVPRGMRNFFEVLMVFLREEVALPFLGPNTDKFMPVLWNFFFFILFNNLLGLVPGMTTATGSWIVTAALALIATVWFHACGISEQGLGTYLKNIVPPGLPLPLI